MCKAVNLIKQKKSGESKGRCCTDGQRQQDYISKEDSASPIASTESVILTRVMEAKEECKVIILDIPHVFIQLYLENKDKKTTFNSMQIGITNFGKYSARNIQTIYRN